MLRWIYRTVWLGHGARSCPANSSDRLAMHCGRCGGLGVYGTAARQRPVRSTPRCGSSPANAARAVRSPHTLACRLHSSDDNQAVVTTTIRFRLDYRSAAIRPRSALRPFDDLGPHFDSRALYKFAYYCCCR